MSYFIKISSVIFLVTIIHFSYTETWNTTYDFTSEKMNSFKSKSARLLSFDSSDGEVVINLEFSLPFLKIPIQKSVDFAKNVVAKVNLPSLALTGLIIFISAIFLPAIVVFLGKKLQMPEQFIHFDRNSEGYRDLNLDATPFWKYGTILDNILIENNIDSTSCFHRSICYVVHKSKIDIINGNASSMDKIIDGVISNEWILDKIYNTSIYAAVKNGLNNGNCNGEYRSCKFPQKFINTLVKDAINFLGI